MFPQTFEDNTKVLSTKTNMVFFHTGGIFSVFENYQIGSDTQRSSQKISGLSEV